MPPAQRQSPPSDSGASRFTNFFFASFFVMALHCSQKAIKSQPATSLLHNLAVLNADNPIGKAGNAIIVRESSKSRCFELTGALDNSTSALVLLSRLPVGSSAQHNNQFGNQGAGDNTRCCPPERLFGIFSSLSSSPTR